jgi:hypothetical protein
MAFRCGIRYRRHQKMASLSSRVGRRNKPGPAPERHHQGEQTQPEGKVAAARPPVDLVHTLHHGSE